MNPGASPAGPPSANRIRLLPEQLANQIAAGEVVERPASVVKELVENALDAGATRVHVEIQAGGRALIRVVDDGCGMGRDDALLCLERHATSKIRAVEDLAAIATLGFRGEALPSIASVCRLTLSTRERAAAGPEGTQIVIHGGKILEVRATGCPPGTDIEARSLFYNIPARRKFLRADTTERAHVQHYLTLAALSHPATQFSLVVDGRAVWRLPAAESGGLEALRERFRGLYGPEAEMLPVDFSGALQPRRAPGAEESDADVAETTPVRVWGLLGAPGVSRSTREAQHLFVNRRPVENRGLNHALAEGYHTMLMKGRHPVTCLFVEVDPAEVDVNIHPSKKEVKFRRERDIRGLVTQAVRQALMAYHQSSLEAEPPPSPLPKPTPPAAPRPFSLAAEPAPPPPPTERDLPNFVPPPLGNPLARWTPPPAAPTPPAGQPPAPSLPAASLPRPSEPLPAAPVPLLNIPLRPLGILGRLYVLFESDRGLVLMDQHAAHERVLFERLLDSLQTGAVPSQRLLLPETIELGVRDAAFTRENMPALARLGVGLGDFGERTFLLDSLPPFVKSADAKGFTLTLIDGLKTLGGEVNTWRLGEEMVAKTVCRHAVKANDPLGPEEVVQLLEDLRRCRMPYTCPHGRPTLIELGYRELEKKFGRTA